MTTGTGEDNLRNALARLKPTPKPHRQDDPCPGEEDWGWWVEKRLEQLSTRIDDRKESDAWLIRLAIGIFLAEVLPQVWGVITSALP